MKPFKSLILVLGAYLFIAAVLTAQVHAQAQTQLEEDPQAAAHFDAGVAAYQANDLPLAYEEFLAAAREGHADSQFNVALMYEQGLGVGKDEQEAVVWYGKSAAQGNSSAQYNALRKWSWHQDLVRACQFSSNIKPLIRSKIRAPRISIRRQWRMAAAIAGN